MVKGLLFFSSFFPSFPLLSPPFPSSFPLFLSPSSFPPLPFLFPGVIHRRDTPGLHYTILGSISIERLYCNGSTTWHDYCAAQSGRVTIEPSTTLPENLKTGPENLLPFVHV